VERETFFFFLIRWPLPYFAPQTLTVHPLPSWSVTNCNHLYHCIKCCSPFISPCACSLYPVACLGSRAPAHTQCLRHHQQQILTSCVDVQYASHLGTRHPWPGTGFAAGGPPATLNSGRLRVAGPRCSLVLGMTLNYLSNGAIPSLVFMCVGSRWEFHYLSPIESQCGSSQLFLISPRC